MKGTARRDELLRIVREKGYINVTDAAARLGVDNSTVRRDLSRLVELGLVQRSHGGALPLHDETEVPYGVKIGHRVEEKTAIGQLVAATIPDGASVILDAGSTTLMVAQALSGHSGVTVITADVRIAAELVFRPEIRLIMPGGEALIGTSTLLSQEAVESVRGYHADFAVIAADAIDTEVVSNNNSTVVPLKRAMMGAGRQVILTMDSSKFGTRKLAQVAPVHEFSEIVTDESLGEATAAKLPVPVRRAAVEAQRPVSP